MMMHTSSLLSWVLMVAVVPWIPFVEDCLIMALPDEGSREIDPEA